MILLRTLGSAQSGGSQTPSAAPAAVGILLFALVYGIFGGSFMAGAAAAEAEAQRAVFFVWAPERGEVLYERPVSIGEMVVLQHTHSVTLRPVVETFTVQEAETLALIEMRFDDFGPNLPVGPEVLADEETTFVVEEGIYRVFFRNRTFAGVPLRVGSPRVNHELQFEGDERIFLLDLADAGTHVELQVRGHRTEP